MNTIEHMRYKVIIVVCILLLIGLLGFTVKQYSDSHKPVVMVPVTKYQQTLDVLKLHDAVNAQNVINYQAKVADITSKRDQLCIAIKTTKLVVNPALCQ